MKNDDRNRITRMADNALVGIWGHDHARIELYREHQPLERFQAQAVNALESDTFITPAQAIVSSGDSD